MIELNNIYKKFGKVEVLKGINLNIDKGGVFAILGPNGSGKTTLIKSILGMVIPDKGSIKVDNAEVLSKWLYRNNIDYLSQIAEFPANLKVRELIEMIKNLRPKKTYEEELIDIFGLQLFLNKKLAHLSGGTRQKVNIVLTLMFDSDVIILDEPTTGLDPVALILLKQIINKKRKEGKTIIITSHIMSFVEELSDEIVFLLEGKIYFKGSTTKLKEDTGEDSLEHAIAHIIKSSNV
ncbi:MAG: ABC transporter ATP-binding protein [Saprospiraceae bacterium]